MTESDSSTFLSVVPVLIRSRVEPVFAWTWSAAIGCMIAGRGSPSLTPALMAIVAAAFITLSVYLYNDIIDLEMDATSPNPRKKERPLAMGQVDVKDAYKLLSIAAALGLLTAFFINLPTLIVAVTYFVLFMLYSYPPVRLKKRFVVKTLVTSTAPLLCALIGGSAISGAITLPVMFAGGIFGIFGFLTLPAISDTFDIEEDTAFGMKTMGMMFSWRRKMQLMVLAVLITMTLTPLTYVQLGFNVVLPIFVVALSLVLLSQMYPMMNIFEELSVRRIRKFITVYYLLVQILMVIGTLNLSFLPF